MDTLAAEQAAVIQWSWLLGVQTQLVWIARLFLDLGKMRNLAEVKETPLNEVALEAYQLAPRGFPGNFIKGQLISKQLSRHDFSR